MTELKSEYDAIAEFKRSHSTLNFPFFTLPVFLHHKFPVSNVLKDLLIHPRKKVSENHKNSKAGRNLKEDILNLSFFR